MYAVIANKNLDFTDAHRFATPKVATPVYLDDRLDVAQEYARYIKSKGQDGVRLVKMSKEVNEMINQRGKDVANVPITLTRYLCMFQIPIKIKGQYDPNEQAKKHTEWAINEVCKANPELASLYK